MHNKIKTILEKNGIDLAFAPDLADDLEFAFQMNSPVTPTDEIKNLKALLAYQTNQINDLRITLKRQYKAAPDAENYTISQAKKDIFESPLLKMGVNCHVCGQHVKMYWRSINGSQASELIRLYRLTKQKPNQVWFHATNDLHRKSSDSGIDKLRHWGLVEEADGINTDTGGRRSGFWKITVKGMAFVEGREHIPKYVKIYNAAFYGFDGESITIYDCLGKRFNYQELMNK